MSSDPGRPSELIYLPAPSAFPALVAVGIALLVLGVFAWWPYSVVGAILAIVGTVAWLKRNRADIARMPRQQETESARIPLRGR